MRWFILLFVLIPLGSTADVPAEKKHEVDHLIQFVKSSSCQFKRNFSYHSATEAIDHMLKKYEHFKEDIETTEDFIRLSASKSLLTGKAYKIKCDDAELMPTNQWLLTELKTYREAQKEKDAESSSTETADTTPPAEATTVAVQ